MLRHFFLQASHVVPAAHVSLLPPPQSTGHGAAAPHSTVQVALPAHWVVQPPFGHFTLQVVLPWHSTVVPVSTLSLHVLPPPHVTLLFVPVESVHSLVPVHVEVQFD